MPRNYNIINFIYQFYSYRVEQAIKINILQMCNTEKENMLHEKIINAIDMHRHAMGLVFK